MIRQTKNYLVGALSGVTLIGIAIAAFVVIVSAQVFHQWPTSDNGADAAKSGLAPAKALGAPVADEVTASAGTDPVLRAGNRAGAARPTAQGPTGARRAAAERPASTDVVGSPTAVESAPSAEAGGEESSTSDSRGGPSSDAPDPSSSAADHPPSSSDSSGANSAGNSASAVSAGSTRSGTAPTASPASSGGNTSTGPRTSGTTIETPVAAANVPPVTPTKPPPVSEVVNETVHGVDEAALGGALESTGVTEVTESVVEGVAGPQTPVGKTVEGAAEAVGGLLGGGQ